MTNENKLKNWIENEKKENGLCDFHITVPNKSNINKEKIYETALYVLNEEKKGNYILNPEL
jgi:hypothetical protein